MKKILAYYKNRKGITIVMIALMLFVLLAFLGLAVDISYMYFAKNQLQVAADAAALAGASNLTWELDDVNLNPIVLQQQEARQLAWKFACNNRSANSNVYLVTNTPSDCNANSPPSANDLNGGNNADGDIVVGNWNNSARIFTPATGSTNLRINALKARPRRTGETPGMPRLGLFIGQIFRFINADWSSMTARASAIATINPIIGPFPTCFPTCGNPTPLKTEWDYDSQNNDPADPSLNPILCSDPNLNSSTDDNISSPTPGLKFYVAPSSQSDPTPRPGMAWTNFDLNDCNTSPACSRSVTDQNVQPYLRQESEVPEICGRNICTGNLTGGNLFNMLNDQLRDNSKQITIGPRTVNGMQIFIPIVSNLTCGVPQQTCPGAQAGVSNPYLVSHFAKIILTYVDTSGQHGIRVIGLANPRQETFTFQCRRGQRINTYTISRWVTSLNCSGCGNPLDVSGSRVRLVK